MISMNFLLRLSPCVFILQQYLMHSPNHSRTRIDFLTLSFSGFLGINLVGGPNRSRIEQIEDSEGLANINLAGELITSVP
jgi:hypothetical protein